MTADADRRPSFASPASRRLRLAGSAALLGGLAWTALSVTGVPTALKLPGLDLVVPVTVVGGVLGAVGLGRWLGALAASALALVLVVSVSPGVVRRLVAPSIRNDPLPTAPVDAVVVLAGSVSPDGRLGVQAVDRLLEGIRLVRQGVAPRLVTSRVTISYGADSINSDADIGYLVETAGPVELEILGPVGTTRLEAERFATRARSAGWSRIVLVTSPLHTRRACASYAVVGLEVVCRASPDRTAAIHTLPRPTDRLQAFGDWLHEALGLLWYRSRGWV